MRLCLRPPRHIRHTVVDATQCTYRHTNIRKVIFILSQPFFYDDFNKQFYRKILELIKFLLFEIDMQISYGSIGGNILECFVRHRLYEYKNPVHSLRANKK